MKKMLLVLTMVGLGLSANVNAKPNKPKAKKELQPTVATAKACYGRDTPACNKVFDKCEKSKTKQCRTYIKTIEKMADEEYGYAYENH